MWAVFSRHKLGMNIIHNLLPETPLLSRCYTPLANQFIHRPVKVTGVSSLTTGRRGDTWKTGTGSYGL